MIYILQIVRLPWLVVWLGVVCIVVCVFVHLCSLGSCVCVVCFTTYILFAFDSHLCKQHVNAEADVKRGVLLNANPNVKQT